MHLHGIPEKGALTLSTGVPRHMRNDWDVGLTSISYAMTDEFHSAGEELEIIFLAEPGDIEEHHNGTNNARIMQHATPVRDMGYHYFSQFARAYIFKMRKHGKNLKSPSGILTLDTWMMEMNNILKNDLMYKGAGLYLFRDGNKCGVAWHYMKDYENVYCFPIFSQKIRRMIGMPEPGTSSFKSMIDSLTSNRNIILPNTSYPFKEAPILVECNMVEHNGLAEDDHQCQKSTSGHILRMVESMDTSGRRSVHHEYTNTQYVPVQVNSFTEIKLRMVSSDSLEPIITDGMVNMVLHFRPRDKNCSVNEERAYHPMTRGLVTPSELGQHIELELSSTYGTASTRLMIEKGFSKGEEIAKD